MMRNLIGVGLISLMFILIMPAQAANVDFTGDGVYETYVGNPDTLLFQTTLTGSPDSETVWANSVLTPTVDWTVSVQNVDYYDSDLAGYYGFQFSLDDPTPEYYIIKNATQAAIYENVDSLLYALFSPTVLNPDFHFGDDLTISHVTQLESDDDDGTTTSNVPEPGSLLLMSLGLFGFVAIRKYRA